MDASHSGKPIGDLPIAREGISWLILLCASRLIVSLAFMMYAGALPRLVLAWNMSSGEAGLIQTAFNVSYAFSLVLTGWLSDSLGAKRVFIWSSWLTAIAGLATAAYARSYESGFVLFSILGLLQGGTYTPSIMLVAQGVAPSRRGLAIGLLLAGASLGYVGSIAFSRIAAQSGNYVIGFAICGCAPTLAAVAAWVATRTRPNIIARKARTLQQSTHSSHLQHQSILLTLGYTAHCWELLGMWAWMPAFLVSALANSSGSGTILQGVWIAVAIHLSGCISAFSMGYASDRLGRRAVLITMGLLGAICSFSIGWLDLSSAGLILALAAIYGFSALGDSPVLSTAMTESVAPGSLGSALALRSILGFGAGGLAPLVFGTIRDEAQGTASWGLAFSCLGIGGLLAALCAVWLPRKQSVQSSDSSSPI
jgi:MFS family permease